MKRRGLDIVALAIAGAVVLPIAGNARSNQAPAAQNATVEFAMPQPQPPGAGVPGSPDNASTHFLLPDDVSVSLGGTVTFVVNGGGHAIAIHEVSKKTTRDDIAADLCQGPAGADESDRRARNTVCNGTIQNQVVVNGTTIILTGTENLNYQLTDGKDRLVIEPGFNITAANSGQTAIVAANPRVDDHQHSDRLLATSGASPGDTHNPPAIASNPAGAFLAGTANPATAGVRIQVQFNRVGRYLVVCMNRAHLLNDHMFGFVSVVGDEE